MKFPGRETLSRVAGLEAEHLDIPGLNRGNIIRGQVVVNVIHLNGRGERGIPEHFNVDAFRSCHVSLIVKTRGRGLRHLEAGGLPLFDKWRQIFNDETEMIHHGCFIRPAGVALAQQDVDAGELDLGELIVLHHRAAEHVDQEAGLGFDVFHDQVNVPQGYAGGIGRRELRGQRRGGQQRDYAEGSDSHRQST